MSGRNYSLADVNTIDNCYGGRVFQRVFICPVQSQLSFIQMRKFMAVDGTFLKAPFVQSLLLAIGINANGKNVLLAWAIVENENKSSWLWFFSHLKQAIPQSLNMTLISDHNKGLLAGDEVLGNEVNRLICCFHLKCNFAKRYRMLEHHFWTIANSLTAYTYFQHMQALRSACPAAADYLSNIDGIMWVTAFYSGSFFGHKTSKVVESTNKALTSEWELSVLDLLSEIWNKTMIERFKRFTEACNKSHQQTHTKFCIQKLLQSQQWATQNRVAMSSNTLGIVTQLNGKEFEVNLDQRVCSCGHFLENGIPCGHAFTCIFAIGKRPRQYVPDHFTIETWKNTYLTNLSPISLEHLNQYVEEECDPPVQQRAPMDRPPMLRKIPGYQRKKAAQAALNQVEQPPVRGKGSQSC